MGKASRWMINFLLGKKEERDKNKDVSSSEENVTTPTSVVPTTPIIKRKWSFGRSSIASKERTHRRSKTFDAITTTLTVKAVLELENQQMAAAVKTNCAERNVSDGSDRAVQNTAATKIQALFRSYCARKALHALRGLVKLQALVRGHLVRKQTAATLRHMQALMAIQVRARFQRIQMAEESQLVDRSRLSAQSHFRQDNRSRRAHREAIDTNLYRTCEVLTSKQSYSSHSQIERTGQGLTTYYSGGLSFPKQELQYAEYYSTAQNTPQKHPTVSKPITGRDSFTIQQANCIDPLCPDCPCQQPNYMANTQSSRAKSRSHSEPKQRPKWTMRSKSKQRNSIDGTNDLSNDHKCSSVHSKGFGYDNQEPWFIKLHQSKSSDNGLQKYDDSTTTTSINHSNYCKFLAYEARVW